MYLRLKIFILLIALPNIGFSQDCLAVLDFQNPPPGYMVWKSDQGTHRVWTGAQYILVNDSGITMQELPQFRHVDDYREGVALVVSKSEKCGFLNLQGKIVIHPKWSECSASSGGFVTVKDRYEDFYLLKNTGEKVDLKFKSVINIQGMAMAEDKESIVLYIDLSKVNFAYYHPLMKAILRVDDKEVYADVVLNEQKILFRKMGSDIVLYELKIQSS